MLDKQTRPMQRGGLIVFLALISVAFVWIAWPFVSALLWAVLAAIMFQPLYLWILRRLGGRENRAAIVTLLIIFIAVIVPTLVVGAIVLDEATRFYLAISEQEVDPVVIFNQVHDGLPVRLRMMLDNSGYGEFSALEEGARELLQESLGWIGQQALAIGGGAFSFVLSLGVGLYVTYFLLRDGQRLGPKLQDSLPMDRSVAVQLTDRFASIVRATIKGSVVVGLVQGALGAITFWIAGVPAFILFGVLMALFSLLPALGPAIVWVPVALYLVIVGDIWQAVVVVGSGVGVIGLADNILRPILVGRDTGIPDWLILVTTLGGIALMGLSGIVVGPVIAGLFLTGWAIWNEREGRGAVAVGEAEG